MLDPILTVIIYRFYNLPQKAILELFIQENRFEITRTCVKQESFIDEIKEFAKLKLKGYETQRQIYR